MADDKTVQVLKDLNLEHLVPRFEEESITLDIINKLSLEEFNQLGVLQRNDVKNLREKCIFYGGFSPQKVAGNGAPKFAIPKLLLENLIEEGFTAAEISKIVGVSDRTVYRRMSEYNLSKRNFTNLNDAELDEHMIEVCSFWDTFF